MYKYDVNIKIRADDDDSYGGGEDSMSRDAKGGSTQEFRRRVYDKNASHSVLRAP